MVKLGEERVGEYQHLREDMVVTINSCDATSVDTLLRPFRWAGDWVTTRAAQGGAGR